MVAIFTIRFEEKKAQYFYPALHFQKFYVNMLHRYIFNIMATILITTVKYHCTKNLGNFQANKHCM